MTPRPHDALFKATFGVPEHAIALFRAVLPPAVFASLEWRELRVESASFVDTELADYLPRFRIFVEDISHTSNEEIRRRVRGAAVQLVWRLLRDARDPRKLVESVDDWSELYDEAGRRAPHTVAHIQRYVDHVAEPALVDEFRAKLLSRAPTAGEIAMRWSEILQRESREQGIEQGRLEGIEAGRLEGQRATLRQLLEARFRELTPELVAKLDVAPADALERYTERLFTADSAAAVLAD